MCGRYASARKVEDLAEAFGIPPDDVRAAVPADWNVAPTKQVPAVVTSGGRRLLVALRWGLVPAWAADPSVGPRMINARVETVGEKPAFREALAARRCLLPADGWYEWQVLPSGERRPHYLAPADGRLLAFAGLWELWRDADGRPLVTATVVTGPAPADLRDLHERAPVVVAPERWDEWLTAAGPVLPAPTPPGTVVARPVGPAVGDVRANGPELTRPVAVDDQEPLF